MGQAISKRFIVPQLTKATKSYESLLTKDALDDIARKQAIARAKGQKYSDPSAQQGFKRETWGENQGLPKEREQRDFLIMQDAAPKEMPEDLIKFLNDAGPLERKVDKNMTSSKVYESLQEEDQQRRHDLENATQRKRRTMPMMEDGNPEGDKLVDKMDGMTVERTTNFSKAVKEERDTDLKFEDSGVFDLLDKLKTRHINGNEYINEKFGEKVILSEEERNRNVTLLEDMVKYTGIPVLMNDTDKSLVGVWTDKVESLKLLKLRLAPDDVRLALRINTTNEELISKFKVATK